MQEMSSSFKEGALLMVNNRSFQARQAAFTPGPTNFQVIPVDKQQRPLVRMERTGIGEGMVPSNNRAQFGIKRFSSHIPIDMTWQYVPNQVQQVSGRINGTFYIYHEFGHGDDDYLVVYEE